MFAILIALFINISLHATSNNADGFSSGLRLLQEQKFEEASKQFESEYQNGKSFSALYFNWGLSSYRLGKKGLAVALWRRALFFDPELQPAHQALEFIAAELPRQVTEANLSGWPAFRINILDRVSLNKLLFLCWLFFLSAGILLIRHWGSYSRAIKNTTPMPKFPIIGVSIACALLISLFISIAKGVTLFEDRATVISNTVALRTGPSLDDNSIFDLTEGFDVIIKQVQNSWALITVTAGVSGWVPTESLFQHNGKTRLW